MKLMTKSLNKRFSQVGSQRHLKDPLIISKYYNRDIGIWYATEFDPKTREFYGNVIDYHGLQGLWCSFSLATLQCHFGSRIKRDLLFQEQRASRIFDRK